MATKHILVAAGEAIAGDPLVDDVARRAGDDAEVMIVSPALVSSRLDLAAGDLDDNIEVARRKLQTSVDALQKRGIKAAGEVGEADPALAIHDALVKFPADEVVVVTHPGDRATWLEEDAVDRAREELSIPVTCIEVSDGATASPETDDERTDRQVEDTFPASDSPANY